jgi:preprotein translocase SecE subunit
MQEEGTLTSRPAVSDENQAKLDALQQAMQAKDKPGRIQSVLEEIQYIEWPHPLQAASDTAVVIAIVVSASAFLFVLNTLLTELSKLLF